MAETIGKPILNFGVSGYGPNQALLALEVRLAEGVRTPIVILAMVNENLNRIMNNFCLFKTYPVVDMFLAFKPLFVEEDGGRVSPANLLTLRSRRPRAGADVDGGGQPPGFLLCDADREALLSILSQHAGFSTASGGSSRFLPRRVGRSPPRGGRDISSPISSRKRVDTTSDPYSCCCRGVPRSFDREREATTCF